MAGDWLKMDSSTPEKPEVLAITARMGWDDPDTTVGKLFRVWRWFDQHTTDGNAARVTSALLDRIAGVTGFAAAMQAEGWLVVSEAGLSLPKFDRHNGATAKARAQTAKRVANHRASDDCNAEGNGVGVTSSLAREEKRREEKEKPPIPPKGGKSPAVSLKVWIDEAKAKGERVLPDGDPVFAYAESVGIPHDFLHLAWTEFRHRYTEPGAKRYRDWRSVFRKAVRGNWLKLWWLDGQNYTLTTVGQQAKRARDGKEAA